VLALADPARRAKQREVPVAYGSCCTRPLRTELARAAAAGRKTERGSRRGPGCCAERVAILAAAWQDSAARRHPGCCRGTEIRSCRCAWPSQDIALGAGCCRRRTERRSRRCAGCSRCKTERRARRGPGCCWRRTEDRVAVLAAAVVLRRSALDTNLPVGRSPRTSAVICADTSRRGQFETRPGGSRLQSASTLGSARLARARMCEHNVRRGSSAARCGSRHSVAISRRLALRGVREQPAVGRDDARSKERGRGAEPRLTLCTYPRTRAGRARVTTSASTFAAASASTSASAFAFGHGPPGCFQIVHVARPSP